MRRPPSALWLVAKPPGVTSFDVVRAFRSEREGPWRLALAHGGALDPFASGLLLLLVGAATRLFERLHEAPKRYTAVVRWGIETDTGDAGGRTTWETGRTPSSQALGPASAPLLGWSDQVPPATSNKWVDGERAYARAHRGETVVLPPSRVYLHSARWSDGPLPAHSRLELECRGGFYVRAFVRDVGRALGVGAHLTTLERTGIGPWATPTNPVELRGPETLPWLPTRTLTDAELGALRAGQALLPSPSAPPLWHVPPNFPAPTGVALAHRGRLVGVAGLERPLHFPGGI